MHMPRFLSAVLPALALGLPGIGHAALGAAVDSIQVDQSQMKASAKLARRSAYEVHEMTLASGTVVREYAANGTVFGVAWQGPAQPDLRQLLGASFPRLAAAAAQPHGSHRLLAVHEPDLVIESGGRMRAFVGRAYLPGLLPATVSAGDIQ